MACLDPARTVRKLASASDDGLLTYGDIWNAFRPNSPWEGNKTQRILSNVLDRVIYYCVTNGLPILTVLVVRANNRKLSNEAIKNICSECRELGIDVGPDPMAFVNREIELSRNFCIARLPSDE